MLRLGGLFHGLLRFFMRGKERNERQRMVRFGKFVDRWD